MKLNKIEKKVFNFIKTYKIFKKYDKILIAVSGGKDSMMLLHLLNKIAPLMELTLSVAHFNHKIRRESDYEEEFVKKECEILGIKFYSNSGDVIGYSNKNKIGIEEAARKLRYDFLFNTLNDISYNKIATAHQGGDLLETVIYRITRGSGIYGIGGLTPVNEKLTRPMLIVTLKDVLKYVTINNVKYVNDPSNLSVEYARNRIRHNVISELYKINSNVEENVLRLVETVWEYRNTVDIEFKKRVKFKENTYIFKLYEDIFDAEVLRKIFLINGTYPPNMEETKKILRMKSSGERFITPLKIVKKKDELFVRVEKKEE
ncbi:tRNA lysidine(34) synthetase TilS [Tepiditoga spiralis]|nr:tRNA lysidine(34) synthetase TilS [Tepiditoga spiralis]